MLTAAEKILQKALVGSHLDSSQWNGIQAGLRDRAFFSSKVAEVNILDAARQLSADYAAGGKDLSKIRMEMRDYLTKVGYKPAPGTEGTIKDLFSKARLDVLIKHNVATARGFIQYAEANTPGAFAAFPAQEFKRVKARKKERGTTYWQNRWRDAGGKFYGGRMIARKDDPVWTKLSTFGTPYPPFDWGSGMGVRDISRKEAIRLGVITEDGIKAQVEKLREQRDKGELPSMNGQLQAKIPDDSGNTRGEIKKQLDKDFGDLIRLDEGLIKWRPEVMRRTFRDKNFVIRLGVPQADTINLLNSNPQMNEFAQLINGKQLTMDQSWRDTKRPDGTTHITHFNPDPTNPNNIPLKEEDLEMLPSLWRMPTRIVKLTGERFQAEIDAFDGSAYCLQIAVKDERGNPLKNPKVWSFFRTKMPLSKKKGLGPNQVASRT